MHVACARQERQKHLNSETSNQPNAKDFARLCDAVLVVNDMLTITPWNLSKNFVEVHVHRKAARGILDLQVCGSPRTPRCLHVLLS